MNRKKIWGCFWGFIALCIIFYLSIGKDVSADNSQTVVVGTNAEYAPFEYLDSDGNLTGFDIEIMNKIAEKQNFRIVWKDLPFDSLIGAMEAGDIQVIAAAIGPTEERAKSVDFSNVYYTGSQSIICKESIEYTEFSDICNRKVAVLEGSVSDLIVSGENTDYGIVENAQVVRFKSAASAVMELKNGGVEAVVIDTIMAEIFCGQTEGIAQYPVSGTENDTVFCIAKGNRALAQSINAGLAEITADGTYDALYEKYFAGGENAELLDTADGKGVLSTLKFVFIDGARWKYYLNGLGVTLLISLLSVLAGLVIGLLVAVVRLNAQRRNKRTIASMIASAYVDIIRGTPSVLQLMIIYFAVFRSNFAIMAAVVSFGINSGAYVSEVIRGGILSVNAGQMEAGRSLGLSYGDTMRFVVVPQAIKNILPAMGNEFIQLIKETSILGYVGIVDLTKAANYVSSRTYQMFIPLVAAGMIYYVIVKLLTTLLRYFERRLRESD